MSDFEKQVVTMLEIDIPKCANVYGGAPCTAAGAIGTECFNSYASCQDKANFVEAFKVWRFCSVGAPVPVGRGIRPYIVPGTVRLSPTEIDIEKGLAPRGKVTLTMQDEPDSDVESDPYRATRPAPAGGTFWTRWLARNSFYAGRIARLKTAYFTAGWDDAKFITRVFIIERIDPPDSNGHVKITLKDATKLADRETLPVASGGKLSLSRTASDIIIPLNPGDAADYAAAGYVRLGDEIIQYTSIDGDNLRMPDITYRGRFNTIAAAHEAGAAVQACKVWIDAPVSTVLTDLWTAAGVAPANIDSAGFVAQDAAWLGKAFHVTAVLSEPEKISDLVADLITQIGAYAWWDHIAALVRFKVIAPAVPGAPAVPLITDAANVIEGSTQINNQEDLRLTRTALFYGLASATADRKKGSSYLRGERFIDGSAEGPNENNEIRAEAKYSRWWTSPNALAVRAMANRRIGRYRTAPQRIEISLDSKDSDAVEIGGFADLRIPGIVDFNGAPKTQRCLITRRLDHVGKNARIDLRLRVTTMGGRWAFIAPAGKGDYPADMEYAHIAPASGVFPDGTPGYKIF